MNDNITFHSLYKRYAKDVYRFCYWLSGDKAEAEDLVSETFVKLLTSKKDPQTETVKAYLFTIARNLYLKNIERKKRFVSLDKDIIDDSKQPQKVAEIASTFKHVFQVIKKLPEIDRTVLIMKAENDMSYNEIARITGLTIAAIKVKVFRARKKINEYLG